MAGIVNFQTSEESSNDENDNSSPDVIFREFDLNSPLLVGEDEELPSFPLDALPASFRTPIEEVMRHYRVSALLPTVCALVINSAAIGRGLVVKSNVRRTYANLYALIGAKSGTGKSVVFDEFMAPLSELQLETLKEFSAEQKPRAEAELKMLQSEIQGLLKFKRNSNEFDIAEDARHERLSELLQAQAVLEDKLEFASRLWCSDFTSEALAMLLAGSGEQMSVLSDEGGLALYNMLGRYTKGDITDDILLCKSKTVNCHAVDRMGRPPIVLSLPCVALLLLVQPDLLRKAFSNKRLLVGGFLARCLAADSKMEVQYENEETLPEADPDIMSGWNNRIRSLVKTFRFAEEAYFISVQPEVRVLSRKFHNEIVDLIRGELSDVSAFASRWVERAWEISLNLHSGLHGVECYKESLTTETFSHAIRIVRYFMAQQLEVLQMSRIQTIDATRERLEEIFSRNQQKPITLRDLKRRHGLDREEVLSSVKSHRNLFGAAKVSRLSGGPPSCLIFLQSNPPLGWLKRDKL
jgi:Protein of unknown function (DUF3987)